MTDNPRRRLADHVSGSPTFIGAGSALTGNLECGGDLVVAGSVNGDSTVRGSFTLSEGGRWEGRISAANAVISGEVEGTLAVAEKLEIRADRAAARRGQRTHDRRRARRRDRRRHGRDQRRAGRSLRREEKGCVQQPVRLLTHCVSSATPAVST